MRARQGGAPHRPASGDGERLQKALARAGVASRRQAEVYIQEGRVEVNGVVVTELGSRVQPGVDEIRFDGQAVAFPSTHHYYALYKPVGYLSTVRDPHGHAARDLVPSPLRLYPVGRLDRESEGLLLFTDDGALAQRLMHPRYEHEKEYLVLARGRLSSRDMASLRKGIRLDAQAITLYAKALRLPADWRWRDEPVPEGWYWVRIILKQGHKRQIRLLLQTLGYPVGRLIRVRVATLRLGALTAGQGRWLSDAEAESLRHHVGLSKQG